MRWWTNLVNHESYDQKYQWAPYLLLFYLMMTHLYGMFAIHDMTAEIYKLDVKIQSRVGA